MISCVVLVFTLVTVSFATPELGPELTRRSSKSDELESDPGVQGAPVNKTTFSLGLSRVMGVCDGTKQIVCDNCNTLRVCLGGDQTVLCPTDQPYCNYGTTSDRCSGVPISGTCDTDVQNVAVSCSAVGFLPDASNCRIYHRCINVGTSSSVYTCPTGYVFNAALEQCALENLFSRCVRLQCSINFVGHVRYGLSNRFYGFCDGSGQAPVMFRCPNRANFNFITGSTFGECVYLCPGQGNFPNSNDPATYFQCFWANRRLRFNLVHCSGETMYNAILRYCT